MMSICEMLYINFVQFTIDKNYGYSLLYCYEMQYRSNATANNNL